MRFDKTQLSRIIVAIQLALDESRVKVYCTPQTHELVTSDKMDLYTLLLWVSRQVPKWLQRMRWLKTLDYQINLSNHCICTYQRKE